ncbi:MAG TPA: diacylglycerol kinase family protein [Gemmatimonadaceae bacterium]|jgi:diacylglycerol kinase (ATP)|nr:diacylglycerol kinase family protein [Gemmatimonadaceae bacterium]
MSRKVCVIINPASGKGRGAKAEPRIRAAFGAVGVTDIRSTTAKGDERHVALRAIEDGVDTIVAVGGDGTWGNVANAILGAQAPVRLAFAAAGTGNDFAKTVGAPALDFAATARLAVDDADMLVDVGQIEGKYFLNVAGFGFDIAVIEDVERITWLRGNAVYLYSALRQLFGYQGMTAGVTTPAHGLGAERRHLMLIVANGKNFGGAFRIAPAASVTDGQLDAVSIAVASPFRRMKLFASATRGTHVALPEVRIEQAPSFRLAFAEPPAYETDGEYNRARSAVLEVSCVPGALRVVTPAAAVTAATAVSAATEAKAATATTPAMGITPA